MKNFRLIFIGTSLLATNLLAATSTTTINSYGFNSTIINLATSHETNFDYSTGNSNENANILSLGFSSNYLTTNGINWAPTLSVDFNTTDPTGNTQANFSNSINSTFNADKATTYKIDFSQSYDNNLNFNDEHEFTKQESYSLGLSLSLNNTIDELNSLELGVSSFVEDHLSAVGTNPDEKDNLSTSLFATYNLRTSDQLSLAFPASLTRTMYRTAKAKLADGNPGPSSAQADTYNTGLIGIKPTLSKGEFSLNVGADLQLRRDERAGGRDFNGSIISASFNLDNDFLTFSSSVTSDIKSYTQALSELTQANSELLSIRETNFSNTLTIKKINNTDFDFTLSHLMTETSSNRKSSPDLNSINQVFKVGLGMNL